MPNALATDRDTQIYMLRLQKVVLKQAEIAIELRVTIWCLNVCLLGENNRDLCWLGWVVL